MDASGRRFWNATSGCCDFGQTGVDDVAYLRDLLHRALAARPIDPARVYFVGHSNGAFMSYRMACALSPEIAAIGVIAGSDYPTDTECVPTMPLSVLHLHGTADPTIPYAGGSVGLASFPGAVTVVARWAARAGCSATPTMGAALDIDSTVAGPESTPSIYGGCHSGLDVELMTMQGTVHIPTFVPGAFGTSVLDWLLAHHR